MLAWWNDLTLFQMIMVCIATPATLIIIIQMILLLIGFGGDESFDTADGMDGGVDSVDIDTVNSEGFLSFGGIRVFTLQACFLFYAWAAGLPWRSIILCPPGLRG